MKKVEKVGFTLIEIIGAIVILGVIAVIAFATYTASLRGFRNNYYSNEVKTIEKSAEEFFSDNRNYKPTKILNAQEVLITTLTTQEYTSGVVDYNGNPCDESSYVMIVKEGIDEYSYHACLICNKDGYDNTEEDIYCDKTWLDPTKVEYGLGKMEKTYVYKGTTRDKLKDELELPVAYIRKNNDGKVIAERRGTKEGNETLFPIDLDSVNTEVLGNYKVIYRYGEEESEREVEVYENESPTVTYKKENTVIKNIKGDEKVEKTNYTSGEWAQSIIVNLKSKKFVNDSISTSKFQWNIDGRWEDFCDTDPCEIKITKELNQSIQFRLVDTKGNISLLTNPVQMRIDNTKPWCTLKIPTQIGKDNWYTQDVTITFNEKLDQKSSDDNRIVSGIKNYNIQQSTETLKRVATIDSVIHKEDTANITYKGYVEDAAENFAMCEISFKRDTTPPTCTIEKSNLGTTTGLTATINCSDSGSGCDTERNPKSEANKTSSSTYVVYDKVGHSNTCNLSVIAQKQIRIQSCGKGNRCNSADCETYKECVDKNCGAKEFNTCRTSACGIESYNRCEAAGCETFNSCSNKACGVAAYKTCKNKACGTETKTYSGKNPSCDDGCINMGGASDLGSGMFRWNCTCYMSCATSACGVASYYSCRTSACGCETYKSGSACGVNKYNSCAAEACGVKSYKSCRTSGCGCETRKESIPKCGCSVWGDWTNWQNTTACTAGESGDHGTVTDCRVVYN